MTGDGPKIVIEGTRTDWPGGARTLLPRDHSREPNGQTFWFGAEVDPDGCQVWFRITSEALRRMREETPRARGTRLIDALFALAAAGPSVGTGAQPLRGPGLG